MSRSFPQVNPNAPVGGRYRIIRQLGAGGFGRTFLAEDIHLPGFPRCVVKQLKPSFADSITLQMARRCFNTEAEVMYHLGSHDQIPRLLAHFEEHEEFYLVQEFIHGDSLAKELVKGRPWPQGRTIALLRDILTVLSFVHQQQVIHRDLKPSNLMRRKRDGKIVLIDFGAVKQVSTAIASPDSGQSNLTISIGTHGYMPNEQIAGKPRYSSDIYAVGALGIQSLTGMSPRHIGEDERGELAWHHLTPHASRELLRLLDRMVRYDFRERYETAAEALTALNQLTAHLPDLELEMHAAVQTAILPAVEITNVLSYGAIHGSASEMTLPDVELVQENDATPMTGADPTDAMPKESALSRVLAIASLAPLAGEMTKLEQTTQLDASGVQAALPFQVTALPKRPMVLSLVATGAVLVALMAVLLSFPKYRGSEPSQTATVADSLPRQAEAIAPLQAGFYAAFLNFPSPTRQRARELVTQADQLRVNGKNAEALQIYDQAVVLKPDLAEAHWGRCDALNKLGRPLEAIAACNEALTYRPYYAEAVYGKGNAYSQQKQWYEALELYERATRYSPNFGDAWIRRGIALQQLGRSLEALSALEKGLTLRQNSPDGWAARGAALWDLRRFEDAIVALDQALTLQPNQPTAQQLRQEARIKLGR